MKNKITHFRCLDRNPTIRKACEYLGIHMEDIDENFGIKDFDPELGIYSILIAERTENKNVLSTTN